MLRRRRAALCALGYLALLTMTIVTSGLAYLTPLAVIATALLAWDHGIAAALVWIALVRILEKQETAEAGPR
jgi:hypothetical protein